MIKQVAKYVLMLLPLLLIYAGNASAQCFVKAAFAEDSALIGDYLHLKLEATYPKGDKVIYPPFRDSIGKFEIIDTPKITSEKKGDNEIKTAELTLIVFEAGRYTLAGLPAFYIKNGQTDTVFANAVNILVNTVPVDTSKPFKPIKPPLRVPYTFRELAPYIIIPLAIIALAFVVWYIVRHRRKNKIEEKPLTLLDFHARILLQLRQLDERKLWINEVKDFYLQLSEIFRTYLEKRYGILALEATTTDILQQLQKEQLPDAMIAKVKELLETADLAKFAKFKPLPDENMALMKKAIDFVTHTKPRAEAEQQKTVN